MDHFVSSRRCLKVHSIKSTRLFITKWSLLFAVQMCARYTPPPPVNKIHYYIALFDNRLSFTPKVSSLGSLFGILWLAWWIALWPVCYAQLTNGYVRMLRPDRRGSAKPGQGWSKKKRLDWYDWPATPIWPVRKSRLRPWRRSLEGRSTNSRGTSHGRVSLTSPWAGQRANGTWSFVNHYHYLTKQRPSKCLRRQGYVLGGDRG